jgi:hypothetical protein
VEVCNSLVGRWGTVLGVALSLTGCATGVGGAGTFPLVSRANPTGYERLAKVDETRCTHRLLLFFQWGDDANHEAIVTDVLAEHDGDAIVEAELTYRFIPTIIYDQYCARVTGSVARRTGGLRSAADSGPAGEPPAKSEAAE